MQILTQLPDYGWLWLRVRPLPQIEKPPVGLPGGGLAGGRLRAGEHRLGIDRRCGWPRRLRIGQTLELGDSRGDVAASHVGETALERDLGPPTLIPFGRTERLNRDIGPSARASMRPVDEAGDRDRAFQGAVRRGRADNTEEGAGVDAHTQERGPRRSNRDAKEALSEAVARDSASAQAGTAPRGVPQGTLEAARSAASPTGDRVIYVIAVLNRHMRRWKTHGGAGRGVAFHLQSYREISQVRSQQMSRILLGCVVTAALGSTVTVKGSQPADTDSTSTNTTRNPNPSPTMKPPLATSLQTMAERRIQERFGEWNPYLVW